MPKYPAAYYVREAMTRCGSPSTTPRPTLRAAAKALALKDGAPTNWGLSCIANVQRVMSMKYGKRFTAADVADYQKKWLVEYAKHPQWANPTPRKRVSHNSPAARRKHMPPKAPTERLTVQVSTLETIRLGREFFKRCSSRGEANEILDFIQELSQ